MEKQVRRGEVWLAYVDKLRPLLVLSRDTTSLVEGIIIVPPANIDIRGEAAEVSIGPSEGVEDDSVVRVALPRPGRINCNWLISVPETELVKCMGSLSPAKLNQVDELLKLGGLK